MSANRYAYVVDCFGQTALCWSRAQAAQEAKHLADLNGGAQVTIDTYRLARRQLRPGRTLP